MSLYEVLKTIHVLAAAVWVGAGIQQQLASARATAAGTDRLARHLEDSEWMGSGLFAPAAGVAFLSGVGMALDLGVASFKELWIALGLAIFLASSVIGAGFMSPRATRLKELATSKGLDDPEAQALWRSTRMLGRLDLALLVTAVVVMVVKPTL